MSIFKTLFKFSIITFLALTLTWIMLTRTAGNRIVPKVEGLAERDAVRLIENEDLVPRVERAHRKSDPASIVYRQSPPPNAKVKEGRPIRLFVSLGAAQSVMPDLRGLSLTEAKNALRVVGQEQNVRGGLTISMLSRSPHAHVPDDHVISHFPLAGQPVVIGDGVQILLSSGPPKSAVVVPNVAGLSQSQAEETLRAAGLIVHRISKELSAKDAGVVIRVIPAAGTPASESDLVSLVVSTPRHPKISSTPRGILIRYVVPLLMVPAPFHLVIFDREGPRTIYAGTPNPGQVLEFAERVIGDAELKVYIDGILSRTIPYKSP
ncbi:PASTA domain-containing protein [bacterium]|nr:PASTA domain-containing protein [bacterium]